MSILTRYRTPGRHRSSEQPANHNTFRNRVLARATLAAGMLIAGLVGGEVIAHTLSSSGPGIPHSVVDGNLEISDQQVHAYAGEMMQNAGENAALLGIGAASSIGLTALIGIGSLARKESRRPQTELGVDFITDLPEPATALHDSAYLPQPTLRFA
jgi:hypothetical protein